MVKIKFYEILITASVLAWILLEKIVYLTKTNLIGQIMESVNFFEQTLKSLERQYEGKQSLNRKETAKALGIGVSTLDLKIKEGRDLPEYIKIGNAKNSRIIFPLVAIAQYLSSSRQRVC